MELNKEIKINMELQIPISGSRDPLTKKKKNKQLCEQMLSLQQFILEIKASKYTFVGNVIAHRP